MSKKESNVYRLSDYREPPKQKKKATTDEIPVCGNRINIDPAKYADAAFYVETKDEGLDGGKSIYFINASDEPLAEVQYSMGGISSTADGTELPMWADTRSYHNVLPGEAVRVDLYNEWFDSDFLCEYFFAVVRSDGKREELGPVRCVKGLAPNAALGAERQYLFPRLHLPENIFPKPYRSGDEERYPGRYVSKDKYLKRT